MQPFDTLTLETARLRMRPLQSGDAAALYRLHADPVVMRHWSSPPWTDPARADEVIAADRVELARGEHLRLALVRREEDVFVGTCSLFAFHAASRRAELGYALARHAWGQGLMAEALDALVAWAFDELKLNRIEADIDPRNTASARSLARLGFVLEGRMRERWIVSGEVSDAAMYGLLSSEWRARQRGA
jgi:[ribosomal protein S5]-alanine N-acetyltransferase